ncbi:hypothetical protein [Paraburkholderia silvatlantica]|uniref:Uncharacterized protein n=1 Tax=Paraburkholderia silvatlantica TaxID=321895 RepID=A0ABR6FLR0_9BURK|nr:hypothetical protein [Paraburkholderia silvatlantica]MBB2928371.1 hypothetical protein [Paraburkholderia silvatlantica]PVY34584.1 hypothetical protein C7411_107120 [Paraburkholderia silvatlantica]PXW38799.1 hypothetical protein C7413_107120 [Paraburkholderia silvatlantica]
MGGRRWSPEEKAVLKAIAGERLTLISQMHRLPGRTWEGAKNQAAKLDISLSEAMKWTPRERKLLAQIYRSKESIKQGVRRLLPHRNYVEAKGEAQRIGLSGKKMRRGREGYSWVWEAIERALADGQSMTCAQLMVATGASRNSIDKLLARYHGKKVRVGDWARSGRCGNLSAKWELGVGPDALKPPRKTASIACREYRERQAVRAGRVDPFASLVRQVSA